MSIRNIIVKNVKFTSWLTRSVCCNNIHLAFPRLVGKSNRINLSGAFATHSSIKVIGGGNMIEIGCKSLLKNCRIFISGNNCKVIIGENCRLTGVSIWIEDDGGSIKIGPNSRFYGNNHFAVTEGTDIHIGDKCLFSNDISIRTSDSHSIVEKGTLNRINEAQSVSIGSHVWVGNDVKILKGATIGANSVVATGAIITKGNYPENAIIGGMGKVLKESIDWTADRI